MPSGQADSTGLSSVGTSPSGVLKTGDSAVPGAGGSGAGVEDGRDIVFEKGRRAKEEGMGLTRRICGMRELSADARLRHRWQIIAVEFGGRRRDVLSLNSRSKWEVLKLQKFCMGGRSFRLVFADANWTTDGTSAFWQALEPQAWSNNSLRILSK